MSQKSLEVNERKHQSCCMSHEVQYGVQFFLFCKKFRCKFKDINLRCLYFTRLTGWIQKVASLLECLLVTS